MSKLINGREVDAAKGTYVYIVEIATGSAKLQMKTVEMDAFLDVPDSSVTASTILKLDLPISCIIKAVTTDDATNVILSSRKP